MNDLVTKSPTGKENSTADHMQRDMYRNNLTACLRMLKKSGKAGGVYRYDRDAGSPKWKDLEGKFFVLAEEYAAYQKNGNLRSPPTLHMAFSIHTQQHRMETLCPEKPDKVKYHSASEYQRKNTKRVRDNKGKSKKDQEGLPKPMTLIAYEEAIALCTATLEHRCNKVKAGKREHIEPEEKQ